MTTPLANPRAGAGPGALTVTAGTSFALIDRDGDLRGVGVNGAYALDRRIVSLLQVRVDGERPEPLAAALETPEVAAFAGRVGGDGGPPLLVLRRLAVDDAGATLEIAVENPGAAPRAATLSVTLAADLASIFDVKAGLAGRGRADVRIEADRRRARFERDGVPVAGIVEAVGATLRVDPERGLATAVWEVDLAPGGRRTVALRMVGAPTDSAIAPVAPRRPPEPWAGRALVVDGDDDDLVLACTRAIEDIESLRIHDDALSPEPVLAAGAPWFMTLFGRDSLLSSLMTLPADPGLALATARALASLQGRTTAPGTEEEPGRIPHELRRGGPTISLFAHGPVYYGTADATPLFVVLVGALARAGVAAAAVDELLPAVDAALGWLAGPGDPDGDGLVEYERATPGGLANQGWKDSWDAIAFGDGRLARSPIALAEVQAYAFAAWHAGAELAAARGDEARAARRRAAAARLRERFHATFVDADGDVALALDGTKRRVDAVASNMGHCLWCGLLEPAVAARTASRLVEPDLWSGWGVRTLSTRMARFDPLSYHNGSVWSHDTAIVAAGLRRAGDRAGARRVARGLLDASAAFGGQLPELFAGTAREAFPEPVPYPGACAPQAWASAAPLLLLCTLAGLHVHRGRLCADPLPGLGRLLIDGVAHAGARHRVEILGDRVRITARPGAGAAVA